MRRKIPGGRVAPHPALPSARPPPSHGPSNKTAGAPRSWSDATQPSDAATSRSVKAKGPRLKSVMRVSALLSSGGKTSGQPPAIHPPWNKARVRPAQEEERSRNGLEEEAGARERENKIGEATGRRRTSREVGTWERNAGGGAANNEMRLGFKGGGGVTAEHRAELPGLSSTSHFTSLGSGIMINGSYFQTAAEASQPPAVKQKLSEALSLISLARRVQGPARVGDEQRGSRRSWRSTGETSSSAVYGSVGDMSVSAAVSQRAAEEERSRRHTPFRGGNISTQTRGNKLPDSDTESGSGSKESSASAASGSTSSERDRSESDRETEEDESDSDGEEGSADAASETGSQSRSESESEEEEEEFRRKPSKDGASSTSRRKSKSAKVEGYKSRHSSDGTDPQNVGCAGPAVPSCRPQTSTRSRSSYETIKEDSEEEKDVEGEDEEAKSVGSGKSGGGDTSSDQSDTGSGLMDASDDLSPIMEDTEEEEEERSSGSHGEDRDDAEEEGDLENESAD